MRSRKKRKSPLYLFCPVCFAQPGRPCVTVRTRKTRAKPHSQRAVPLPKLRALSNREAPSISPGTKVVLASSVPLVPEFRKRRVVTVVDILKYRKGTVFRCQRGATVCDLDSTAVYVRKG